MARTSQTDLLKRLTGGRASTMVGSAAPRAHEEGPAHEGEDRLAPEPPRGPEEAPSALPEPPVEVSQAPLETRGPVGRVAPPEEAPREVQPPVQPRSTVDTPVSPLAATLLTRLNADALPVSAERGTPVNLRLDRQLDNYIRVKFLTRRRSTSRDRRTADEARSARTTLVSVIREAVETPAPEEIMVQAKAILNNRRASFGLARTNVEVTRQILEDVDREVDQYSTSKSVLSQAAVIEIRLLCWAAAQEDWPTPKP